MIEPGQIFAVAQTPLRLPIRCCSAGPAGPQVSTDRARWLPCARARGQPGRACAVAGPADGMCSCWRSAHRDNFRLTCGNHGAVPAWAQFGGSDTCQFAESWRWNLGDEGRLHQQDSVWCLSDVGFLPQTAARGWQVMKSPFPRLSMLKHVCVYEEHGKTWDWAEGKTETITEKPAFHQKANSAGGREEQVITPSNSFLFSQGFRKSVDLASQPPTRSAFIFWLRSGTSPFS